MLQSLLIEARFPPPVALRLRRVVLCQPLATPALYTHNIQRYFIISFDTAFFLPIITYGKR